MAVSVSRKKPRLSKRLQSSDELSFFSSFLEKILLRFPAAFFMLVFIYIWCSSTTILSGNIVHLCVSSRKLNNLYCLSAGTQPNFQIPVLLANHTSSAEEAADLGIKSSVPIDSSSLSRISSKEAADFGLSSIPTDNSSSSTISGEEAAEVGLKSSIPTDNSSSFTISGEEAAEVGLKSSVPTDNSSSSILSGEEAADLGPKSTVPADNSSSSTISGEETADFGLKSSVAIDNSSSSTISGEEAVDFDSKNRILAVNETAEYAYREVEEQLKLQRSWMPSSNPATCEGRGIYVYELPPKFNKDLTGQCNGMIPWVDFCKYLSNDGLGEAIEKLGGGWYNTHQYALEPILHARVLKHPCRVYDHKEAMLFYVPYYGGLDVLRWHFTNVSSDLKDSLAVDLVRWLETQESWYRNLGKDHVFVLGKISWDFRRNKRDSWGTRFLELDEMQNPAKLLIERHPWRINDVGIPHPTYFHPHTDDDIVKWQLKMSRSSRRNIVSFAGAARPDSTESIRSILIEQCTSTGNGEHCRFLNCTSGQCDRPDSIIELFTESEFCLQPPGDSPTRKSVFDSLISGCIPVLFDPMTAYYQYPWHLPEDGEKYSIFIDKEEVRNRTVNVVEKLIKIPERERENMRRYIVFELLPGLVYGDLDSKFDKFQDAFSITINSLLERVTRFNNM